MIDNSINPNSHNRYAAVLKVFLKWYGEEVKVIRERLRRLGYL